MNSTRKVNRYHPPEVLASLDKMSLAEEQLAEACARAWKSFLADFGSHYADFKAAVHAIATLDCLLSLAILSCNQVSTSRKLGWPCWVCPSIRVALTRSSCLRVSSLVMLNCYQKYTRPQFCEDTESSQLTIQEGRHPVCTFCSLLIDL